MRARRRGSGTRSCRGCTAGAMRTCSRGSSTGSASAGCLRCGAGLGGAGGPVLLVSRRSVLRSRVGGTSLTGMCSAGHSVVLLARRGESRVRINRTDSSVRRIPRVAAVAVTGGRRAGQVGCATVVVAGMVGWGVAGGVGPAVGRVAGRACAGHAGCAVGRITGST